MTKSRQEPSVYAFGENVADRIRMAAYQLSAAIDELLWRCRVEPEVHGQPGHEESIFWESHAKLIESLRQNVNDDHL